MRRTLDILLMLAIAGILVAIAVAEARYSRWLG